MSKAKVVGLIPIRLESSRLPRKGLLDICGLPMIIHVYKRCLMAKSLDEVYVVTDSDEVASVVDSFGGKTIMTRSDHQTGTDRIAEAANKIDADIFVNIQGDEALVNPNDIDKVVGCMDGDYQVAILVTPFKKFNSPSDIKVVLNEMHEVMYLSRSDIPSNSRTEVSEMLKAYHIIPFRKDFLIQYSNWPKGRLEQIEFNEYLRILEKGYKIKAVQVSSSAISVDTQDDLDYVRSQMETDEFFPNYR